MSIWQSSARVKNMKVLTASLFLLFTSSAVAQEATKFFITKQPCEPLRQMSRKLDKWDEKILFTGNVVQFSTAGTPYTSSMLFQVNQDTGTWSLVSIYSDGTACVIASGNEFTPYVK